MCHMDYDEDMLCVVERRNPNNIVTLSHRFPGYHDLCNIVTISATCHITSLFSREFGNARATFLFASRRHCPTTWPQLSKFMCAGVTTSDLAIFNFLFTIRCGFWGVTYVADTCLLTIHPGGSHMTPPVFYWLDHITPHRRLPPSMSRPCRALVCSTWAWSCEGKSSVVQWFGGSDKGASPN